MFKGSKREDPIFKDTWSLYLKLKNSFRINSLPTYKPGKSIEELQRELGFEDAIKLASNENPLGPPSSAVDVIQNSAHLVHLYPDGDCYNLKKKISFKENILPNQIIVGNGSNEVLELVAHTFLEKGDEAIMGEYCFIVYPIVTNLSEASIVRIPMKNLALNLNDILPRITNSTKVIFIANPNNPTGARSTKKDVEGFLEKVPANIVVVLDEAYAEYMGGENTNVSTLINKYENLIILKTFSKVYGLAGLRVGYGMASPDMIGLLNKPREPFNVNQVAQLAATVALDDEEHVRKSIELNKIGMIYLKAELTKMNIKSYPSYANFILIEFKSSASTIYEELLKEGVITRPLENYGLNNHLRITVGLEHENVKLINALKKVVA